MVVDGEVCEELCKKRILTRRNKRWGEGGTNFISDRIELPRRKEPIQIPRSYTSGLDSVTVRQSQEIACVTVMNEMRGMIQ